MLLQNLTLLANDTVVHVTNIAPAANSVATPTPVPVMANDIPSRAAIVSPILPSGGGTLNDPQHMTQIIVSTATPGGLASTTVYTGEPTINGLESARRGAQAAAERAQLNTMPMTMDSSIAKAAYDEAESLGRDAA